jgi:hypothetical protein
MHPVFLTALKRPLRSRAEITYSRAEEFLRITVLVVDHEIPGRLKSAGFATTGTVLL